MEIVGRDSPAITGLPIPEPSGSDANEITGGAVEIEIENTEPPPKKKIKFEKEPSKEEMEKKILKMKLQILDRDCYLKDIDIFMKENELGLAPSKYSQAVHNAKKGL